MKSAARILGFVLLIVALGWGAYVATAPAPPPLSGLVPRGALLYLEAKDFQSLLEDWSASPEKKEWLQSADYSVFSRSALFGRLQKARAEFDSAAGIPPDMKFVAEAAGKQSALALYDIGKLEFLYVTRLPSSRSRQSVLWQTRTKFESRSASGVTFFVHSDAESQRTVAFAVTDEYLVLGTREDLVASALALISGGAGQPLAGEQWFSAAISAASSASHSPGGLRMVLNLEKIVATPHFRTYWIERNVSELKQYSAGISDLYRTGTEYREERILLRAAASANPSAARAAGKSAPLPQRTITAEGAQAAGDLMRLVPEEAGVYRAVANPTADESLALLENKILSPQLGPPPVEKLAPGVSLGEGVTGSAADLETRIDEAPAERVTLAGSTDALRAALDKAGLEAALSIQSSCVEPSGAFVTLHSAIVLRASGDWDGDALRAALASAIEPALSTARLGVAWQQNGRGNDLVFELDGLMPLRLATRGKYLFISDDAALLASTLARLSVRADAQAAAYAAGFNHRSERENFAHLTRTLDRSDFPAMGYSAQGEEYTWGASYGAPVAGYAPGVRTESGVPAASDARKPFFFSENLASLSRSLVAVKSVSVNVRESEGRVLQTVTYHWDR